MTSPPDDGHGTQRIDRLHYDLRQRLESTLTVATAAAVCRTANGSTRSSSGIWLLSLSVLKCTATKELDSNAALRDGVHRLYPGVLYFMNVTRI